MSWRDRLKKMFQIEQAELYPEQASETQGESPDSSPKLDTNKVDIHCRCGTMMVQPPETGPLAAKVCPQCDRIPKGQL